MRTVQTLIDEAAEKCGGYTKLAERVGVSRQRISDFRHGRATVSPETLGALCDVAELDGEEARRLLAVLIVSNPKNQSRAEVLRRAFFVSLALGVVLALHDVPNDAANAIFIGLTVYTLARIRTGFSGRGNTRPGALAPGLAG